MNFLKDIIIQGIFFLILGLIVYILTLKLKFHYKELNINNPRRNAVYALIAVCTSIFIIVIILFLSSISKSNTEVQTNIPYNFSYVFSNAITYLIIMSPILITKRFFRQSWGSTGVSKHNLKKSIVISIIVGIIAIIYILFRTNISIIKVITHLNSNHFWGLLYFAVVGFSEEFIFRGYLQIRLMAWLGKNKGWIISSVLMVLMHLPQRIFVQGMTLTGAFTGILSVTFLSLFLGHIMIKTENIFAPAIFHTLADWGNIII